MTDATLIYGMLTFVGSAMGTALANYMVLGVKIDNLTERVKKLESCWQTDHDKLIAVSAHGRL